MAQDKIAILGLGYVGLPLLMALVNDTEYEAVGLDISERTINAIKNNKCPIADPITEAEFSKSKKLTVDTNTDILKDATVYIICVPTPVDKEYEPDYGPVISASKTVAKYLKKGDVVILESTVNPGTCEEVVIPAIAEISKLKSGEDYDVVHVPERINPGDTKYSVKNLPRNVGGTRVSASERVKEIYSSFISADIRVVSNLKVAEASKIVENSFRDINIAFVNELAKSFDAMEIDLIETIHAASSKFSFMPHWPGPGVGGHCIAVDPYYLIKRAHKAGFNHRLLKEAREINNSMPEYTISKLMLMLNQLELPLKGTKISLLGLSYKPEVGDLRESPSLIIRRKLVELGADLVTYEPFALEKSDVKTLDEALDHAEAIVITTAHGEFKNLNSAKLKEKGVKAVMDSRNCLDQNEIKNSGILYTGIGRQ